MKKVIYKVEESWIGPYDSFPSCKFCRGVGCVYADRSLIKSAPCDRCGWNPEVSKERILNKYGENALQYLTDRKKRVNRNE